MRLNSCKKWWNIVYNRSFSINYPQKTFAIGRFSERCCLFVFPWWRFNQQRRRLVLEPTGTTEEDRRCSLSRICTCELIGKLGLEKSSHSDGQCSSFRVLVSWQNIFAVISITKTFCISWLLLTSATRSSPKLRPPLDFRDLRLFFLLTGPFLFAVLCGC
jgi:hypothetical protein